MDINEGRPMQLRLYVRCVTLEELVRFKYIYRMQIERLDKEIVIRIPVEMDSKKLQNILDLIRYGELTAKSEATQEQVDQMASEINQSWWAKNRGKFIKKWILWLTQISFLAQF